MEIALSGWDWWSDSIKHDHLLYAIVFEYLLK